MRSATTSGSSMSSAWMKSTVLSSDTSRVSVPGVRVMILAREPQESSYFDSVTHNVTALSQDGFVIDRIDRADEISGGKQFGVNGARRKFHVLVAQHAQRLYSPDRVLSYSVGHRTRDR